MKLSELYTECVGVNCGRPPLVDFGVVEVEVSPSPLCLSMLLRTEGVNGEDGPNVLVVIKK